MTNPVGGEENRNPSTVSSGDTDLRTFVLFGVTINLPMEVPPTSSSDSVGSNETTPPAVVPPSSPPPVPQPPNLAIVPDDDNPWTITKKLHQSDVDGSSRLLLGKKHVQAHIDPHIGKFDGKKGVELVVYDVDTRTEHRLTLKKWKTKSYVLLKRWTKDFVKRRELSKNDEIGFRWERIHRRFEFTVIKKAPELTEIAFL
ncbi:putative B3 domain-containing protein At1g78640 [Primulina huaijiensis]|uniref:putative B3 domain-containing protein At1g78640 n=1 Tax=Primulina huaijiensis TaxID=1492673 RepID=UPI003CC6F177